MVAISIMLEGQDGLTWPRWKRLVTEVEALGFAGLFRSDHFTNAQPPDKDSLEMIVSLTYLADHTQRIHFGPLVAPISFRHPTLLARQAAAIDDLSAGRMILGLGAGWQEREHHLFGHPLGDVPTRMKRMEEGLEVVTRLLHGNEPATFEGQFFQLREATLLPRPQRPAGPRILIGGNGVKRTLPMVVRYANIWNGVFLSPAEFRTTSATLDTLLQEAGRKPTDVQRTLMHTLTFARDEQEIDQRLNWRHDDPDLANTSVNTAIAKLRASNKGIIGTPAHIIDQIQEYAAAGVAELMLQWFDLDNIDALRAFAHSVLPYVS
ncbi:MAG: LLM class F420-dependent oxidoreductase [Ktedonobacteraceae bacterium]